MSRTSEVIKNKNKIEKARRLRRKNEMQILRNKSAFKAKLYDELRHIDVILEDKDIKSIIITVPDRMLTSFSAAIYSEDLAAYDIQQVPGTPNKFFISKRIIKF